MAVVQRSVPGWPPIPRFGLSRGRANLFAGVDVVGSGGLAAWRLATPREVLDNCSRCAPMLALPTQLPLMSRANWPAGRRLPLPLTATTCESGVSARHSDRSMFCQPKAPRGRHGAYDDQAGWRSVQGSGNDRQIAVAGVRPDFRFHGRAGLGGFGERVADKPVRSHIPIG
jgi:hypothetical protein